MHLPMPAMASGPYRLFLAVNIHRAYFWSFLAPFLLKEQVKIMSLFDDLAAHLPVDSSMAS